MRLSRSLVTVVRLFNTLSKTNLILIISFIAEHITGPTQVYLSYYRLYYLALAVLVILTVVNYLLDLKGLFVVMNMKLKHYRLIKCFVLIVCVFSLTPPYQLASQHTTTMNSFINLTMSF